MSQNQNYPFLRLQLALGEGQGQNLQTFAGETQQITSEGIDFH